MEFWSLDFNCLLAHFQLILQFYSLLNLKLIVSTSKKTSLNKTNILNPTYNALLGK